MAESSERVSAAPEIVYDDGTVLVCVKPAGVLSTDEPGGLPGLLRERLGDEKTDLRTVHRLDRAVGGLMVLARGGASASALSRQIREGSFEKEYLADFVILGRNPFETDKSELHSIKIEAVYLGGKCVYGGI